ncbi:MAG: DUF2164 domain-containing protein [Haliea sp.]|uniref:DUF2164 domain-containing protein n=1 Tax=Haliea sp. TaxID=1932666 RepID=UPI0032EE3488
MSEIKISREETDKVVSRIKVYFKEELDQEIGSFEAEFLIDFFAKEIGPYFYNRGIFDAQALFADRAQELDYMIQELEKPTV